MKIEPYTIPNFAKTQSGIQMDLGLLTKEEFEQYCKSFLKKLRTNYSIRKKAIKQSLSKTRN